MKSESIEFVFGVKVLSPERFKKDVTISDPEPVCPHCKEVLNKRPKRKTKCSFCGNDIYVRSKPRIFNSTLLTKDDSLAVDWFDKLEYDGIKQKDFLNKREELIKKLNGKLKSTDIILELLNNDLSKALLKYETEAEFFELLQDSIRTRLLDYKQTGLEKVRIISCGGCESCIDLMGKVLTIDDALKDMPVPNKNCKFQLHGGIPGWCRCRYVPFFDDPEIDTHNSNL